MAKRPRVGRSNLTCLTAYTRFISGGGNQRHSVKRPGDSDFGAFCGIVSGSPVVRSR